MSKEEKEFFYSIGRGSLNLNGKFYYGLGYPITDFMKSLEQENLKLNKYKSIVDNFIKEQIKYIKRLLDELDSADNCVKRLYFENKKQKEVIDDYKEDILNLLDIINKNCNELKCTSDEWLVIQKYQDKEVE